jgi:hypothetical protein
MRHPPATKQSPGLRGDCFAKDRLAVTSESKFLGSGVYRAKQSLHSEGRSLRRKKTPRDDTDG